MATEGSGNLLSKRKLGLDPNTFFRTSTDGEVWVQNISDMQLSLTIEARYGGDSAHVMIPATPDPICITDEGASLEDLKTSTNLRKMLKKRRGTPPRPVLILIDRSTAERYYAAAARALNLFDADGEPDVEAAMDEAFKRRRAMTTIEAADSNENGQYTFAPPKTAQELVELDLAARGLAFGANGEIVSQRQAQGFDPNIAGEERIHPKVMHLCHQVGRDVPPHQRMPEEQLLREIRMMSGALGEADWQYIESYGTWPKVKKFARQQLMAAFNPTDLEDLSLKGRADLAATEQKAGRIAPAPAAYQGQYAGPIGFANAPFAQAHSASGMAQVLGPDGQPLE